MNDAMTHHDGIGNEGTPEHPAGQAGKPASGSDRGVVRRRRPAIGSEHAAGSTDRLTAVVHELRNLVDGSLRWVTIAERDLPRADEHPGDAILEDELERTRKQLETVRRALEQMNAIVRTSSGSGLSLGSPAFVGAARVSLGEALDHAVDVVRPRAASLGVEISLTIDERAGPRAAGATYSVMLNALHNAIDSIETRIARERASKPTAGPGRGVVNARLGWVERGGIARVVLEVIDDGVGVPELDDPSDVFEPWYSGREGGQGIGLALSRQIVLELGGRIELLSRTDGPGAVLRAVFPAPGVIEIEGN
jgi:signal transduction histidine kinase